MVISTGIYGNCENLYKLLNVQHEYSKFVTIREMCNLESSDDWDCCMNILKCITNINIKNAQKELAELMEWDDEYSCFNGDEWDYNMLDEILMKYIGKDLYQE